jgi:hypothetical protein
MTNYLGMNYNLDGVAFDCLDGTTIMAFKDDVVQFFTNEVLTSTASRIAMFPEVGNSQITYVYRGGQSSVAGQFYQIWFFNNAGTYWRYEVATPHQNPTTYTFLASNTHSWKIDRGPAGANDDLLFKNDNGVMKVDQVGNTGNFQPYGAGNTLYPTLPNTQIPDACWNNTLDGFVYVSIVDTIYKLDAVTATVVSFAKYNVAPGPPVNIFNGVPHDHQASGIFPNDPTITYFFYYDGVINKVYKHDGASNTTTIHDIGSGANQLFPGLPTNQAMDRAVWSSNGNIYVKWENSPGVYHQKGYPSPIINPGATSTPSDALHDAKTSNTSYSISIKPSSLVVKLPHNGWAIDHQYNQGSWGGTTTPYNGLPQTQHRSMNMIPNNNNQVLVFYDTGIVYTIDLSTQLVVASAPYGATIPPTPLPDIVVTYTSPTDYAYFASNVALVTDTEYGFNFTKTGQANADKMELYLYFATAPGAIPFIYSQLRDLKISMKNNLVLQSGNIFFNVYTVGTAGGWYGTKTTYFGTPPLGTTFDNSLVETIIPLSDSRTDQILAISVGSNTAGQQFNFDVKKTSFEILLPITNETQRVEVQLQSSFIVIDDKYWDLEGIVTAKSGTTIKPDYEIFDFTPNIIAGNYPQSGTAKGPPAGTAWYLAGTWSEWTQTTANVWAPSGNTIQFTSNAVNPGLDTNGAGWVGSLGGVALTGTWSPQPFTWYVIPGNLFQIIHTNGAPINFSPLVDLPQPNNFTPAQYESGMFSSSNVGTMATSVLISNSVSPHKTPIFPTGIDLTFLSETQVIMRRSWEIIDTTYTISSSNVLSGKYVSPTYPNDSNASSQNPDSYTKATPWVVLAEPCPSPIQLLFSGGFINTILASGAYHINVNAPPVGITYIWTANYYDVNNILISPVAGAGTTGTQSNFTIDLLTIPAAAEYVFYTCISNEGSNAVISIILIRAAAATPFVLDFQNQSAQIVVDATYSVTPNPIDSGVTYAYTATYNNEFDASLGNVLGFSQTTPSTFNFVYANMPLGTKYIDYGCSATGGNQGGETARLSISIIPQIPPAPQSFELEFNGGAYPVNITEDGTYNMIPYPTESALIITYTYTANYFEGTTDLGPVVGFDVTGQSSSFPFTFAGMPTGATYIKYVCSASGTGLQNGETAESIIGIVEPHAGNDDVILTLSTTGNIEYKQYNPTASLKLLTGDRLPELKMTLVDSYGSTLFTDKPVYYECEIRSTITKE